MKNVFTNVTWKTLKKNRTRTLVTIVGILLATAMLTAVTTFISSLQQYMIRVSIEENGNWYAASFGLPSEERESLSADKEVTGLADWQELGYASLGEISPETLENYHTLYLYVAGLGEGFADMMPVTLTEGRMPENSQEIVIPKLALTWGLMDVQVGDTLELALGERTLGDDTLEDDTLGPYNPLIYEEKNGSLRVLEVFKPRETREYTVVGLIDGLSFLGSATHPALYALTKMDEAPAADAAYTCFYRIRRASGIYEFTSEKLNDYTGTYNSELLRYMGTSQNRPYMRMLYGLAAILITLIMVGGVSLVYNSFAISVSDRTKQFGLLSSVGATPRQLRGMVFREAFLLSAIGIPLGIAAGILGIGVTLHFTGSYFTYLLSSDSVKMGLFVSWPAVLAAALTALLTVLISAWIPARRAAQIPPIEAIRQSKDVRKRRKDIKKIRRRKVSYRLFGLPAMVAGRHFAREKKQYRTTTFSLFISIVLFISASSFSTYMREGVFDVAAVPDYDIQVSMWDEKGKALGRIISQMEGVEEALDTSWIYSECLVDPEALTEDARRMAGDSSGQDMELESEGRVKTSVGILILDDADFDAWLEEQGLSGFYAEWENEEASLRPVPAYNRIYGYYDSEAGKYRSFEILEEEGTQIEVVLTDSDAWYEAIDAAEAAGGNGDDVPVEAFQKNMELRTGPFVEEAPMNLFAGYAGLYLIMPESQFQELAGENAASYLNRRTLYLKAPEHQAVTERIERLIGEDTTLEDVPAYAYDHRHTVSMEQNMLLTVDVFSYGFITLISLIAAANVFNTISTAFLLRRREFAVLSSVGMTPKEMNRMLSFECLLYGFKALLYGIPVSLIVTWQIYRVVSGSWDIGFYLPAASMVIAVFSVFAVVFATMLYARSKMKQENIIDSIRQESL